MKIACVSTSRIPSNLANSIQMIKACQALAALGHTVKIWVPGDKPVEWQEIKELYGLTTGFEIQNVPSCALWRRYDFSMAAVREAKRWGADCYYTWLLPSAVMALWQGIPTILELHDMVTGRIGPQSYRMFCAHQGTPKRVLFITDALRQRLETWSGNRLAENEGRITPNGMDAAQYQNLPDPSMARKQLGFEEKFTCVYTGHFYAGRGINLLLELAKRCPQVNFYWVGGSAAGVSEWQARLDQLEIKNIFLTGFIPNSRLPLYQAAAEVLLMPYEKAIAGSSGGNSVDICSPMKMFDYMAAGRVIMASDLPVIHEVLNPQNAVFCPPEDVDAWVAALNEIYQHSEKQATLAKQAKLDSLNYSWTERARKALDGFNIPQG